MNRKYFKSFIHVFWSVIGAVIFLLPSLSHALPDGGQVVGGSAAISEINAQQMQISQGTDRAIINWNGFNIDSQELVRFLQPGTGSVALNRVTGFDPSSILGSLQANGRVFLINPNGILFGAGATVDVAGLLATTMNISNDDFMAGKNSFFNWGAASVVNKGQIKVSDNGFIVLVAPGVANEGLIVARLGNVVMGSGDGMTVDFIGDNLIQYAIEGNVLDQIKGSDGLPLKTMVSNSGTIQADGGTVFLDAGGSSQVMASVINQSGIISVWPKTLFFN